MSNQVLFVDDDPALLNTMKRNLGMDYNVQIAEGAEFAVEAIQKYGNFSVVVVDMQMPKTNGIQTIALLRERMPSAVFVMLTGNQDLSTAIQAVNDGRVFRFLTKPSETAEISVAIDAAQKQHNLIIAEKELLSGTFAGAINLMTDLIESQEDWHIDTGRMAEALKDLAERLSLKLGWEELVAARVFMIGVAMLDPKEANDFVSLDPTSPEHKAIFTTICEKSASVMSKLPRLGWIVEVLRDVPCSEYYHSECDRQEVAAFLLRVVFYWNFLTHKGLSVESATAAIELLMPRITSGQMQAIQRLNDNRDAHVLSSIAVSALRPGMVLHEDITLPAVGHLVSRGRRLTDTIIDNLARNPLLANRKVSVILSSIPRA